MDFQHNFGKKTTNRHKTKQKKKSKKENKQKKKGVFVFKSPSLQFLVRVLTSHFLFFKKTKK